MASIFGHKFPNWQPSKWMTDIRPAGPYIEQPIIIDAAMQHHKGPSVLAIQAGGHVGIWPAKLSDYFKQVVSFEPVLENYIACVHNIQASNVLMVPGCLGSRTELVRVANSTGFGGSAKISTKLPHCNFSSCAIPICKLPEWIQSKIDAMFLDVEGHELEILRGAIDVLEAKHPTIVVEEKEKFLETGKAGETLQFLKRFGYRQVAQIRNDLIFIAERT